MATVTLLKQPYQICFSGNPVQFIWQVVPYDSNEKSSDINLTVRVYVENIFNSTSFDQVYVQKLYPDDKGQVKLDVSSIIDPHLEFYTPRPDLAKPIEATAQRKRFKVAYFLQEADQGVVPWSGAGSPPIGQLYPPGFSDGAIFSAVKGGMAYETWHYNEFFTKVILEDKKPLLFSANGEKIDKGALRFIYWIYPLNDAAAQTITYKVYFSDGTSATLNNDTIISSGQWSVACAPAGFSQCGLDALVPEGKSSVKYSITIATADDTIVAEYFFDIDHRNFYEPYYILYRNSVGGLETMRITGQADIAAEYLQQQAQRTLPPNWYNPNLVAQIMDDTTEETLSFTGDTGFLSKEGEMKLRDLLLSKQKWMISSPLAIWRGVVSEVDWDDVASSLRLLPIALSAKNIKFFSNKESLVSATIQWQLAFVNSFFTPGNVMPLSRTCPAVEKLSVFQKTKNTLQIIWSLQLPYEQVEVQIIIGATTYTYTYQGNTGMIVQSFENPATTGPVDITIKGRTICNADSDPVDYGVFSIITLSVIPDSLPIAVDDYFIIPAGGVYPIPVSALANDYDPDGDPIEVVAAWGMTDKGAVWTIDAAGFVTFKPANVAITGDDKFVYYIRNVGGTTLVAATVHIKVGDGVRQIFVRWGLRNIQNAPPVEYAEGWLEYFSDPACTVPFNISAFGITVNAKVALFNEDGEVSGGHNYAQPAHNTADKVWTGNTIFFGIRAVFTVLPGTGYIPVN